VCRSRKFGLRGWLVVGTAVLSVVFLLVTLSADLAWATPPQQGGSTVPTPTPGKEAEEEEPGPAPPVDLPTVDVVPWTVGPSGGQLDLKYGAQGCLLISVEPGVLSEEILFEVAAKPSSQAPPDTCTDNLADAPALCKTNTLYTLDGWYRQRGQPVGTDLLPNEYVHTICYTDADLALAGGDPHNFVIASYDDASASWQTIPTSVDMVNRNVSGVANHLSWWALMVKKSDGPLTLPETGGQKAGPGTLPSSVGLVLLLAVLSLGPLVHHLHLGRR
jgi:hypothetical protein